MSGLVLLPLLLLSAMCRESLTADSAIFVDATQHKLPKSVTPQSYKLHLEPDLEKFTFNGIVEIKIKVNTATNVVTLNAKNLSIDASTSIKEEGKPTVLSVTHIATGEEMVTLTLDGTLKNNSNYIMTIPFSGTLNDEKRGFYRSRYLTENGTVIYIATTHFEPTGARRAFPCWDEPEYKATFDISIKHLNKYTAISNMPQKSTSKEPDGKKNTTVFETTPPMSTYLVAFVVSDYGHSENKAKTFRVWTKPHAVKQTEYALDLGEKVINELNNYTNFKYSDKMPKMDQITIKDFTAGAMENWGLVTYRETALLYDENTTSTSSQFSIATIIAHEFAHQWFGNLVSPKWWKYIWLNEGFATYFQYYIIDKLNPDWRVMDVFVTNGLQARALATDAGEKTRAMNKDAQSPSEISALFDRIAYEKAGSIIRMMSFILSPEKFQKGLQEYLQKYKYSNADSKDLISTLDAYANQKWEGQNLTQIMDGWVNQAGSPVVVVKNTGDKVELTQKRFMLDNPNNGNDDTKWWVPITLVESSNLDFTNTTIVKWLNPGNENATTIPITKDNWVIVNIDQTGYYRVNYDDKNWKAIIQRLSENYTNISPLNRAQLVDDAFNLAQANQLDYTVALSLAMYLTKEVDYIPWNSAFRNLNFLDSKLQNTQSYPLFQDYIKYFMKGLKTEVTYEPKSNDTHVTKMLRTNMVKYGCKAKEPECTKFAQEAFNAWTTNSAANPLHPDLKNSIICAGLRSADEAKWNKTKDILMESTHDQEEKDSLLPLMGCSGDEKILEKFLRSSLEENSEVDFNIAVQAIVYDHVKGVDIALKVIADEQEKISKLERKSWVETIGSAVTTEKQLTELIMLGSNVGVQAESFMNTLQTMRKNIQWRNSHAEHIGHWLTDNKNTISSATTITFTSLLMIVSIVITRFY